MNVSPCSPNTVTLAPRSSNERLTGSGCETARALAAVSIMGNSTEVTNDDTAATDDLVTFASCASDTSEELADKDGIEQLDIEYNYEISITEEANLSSSVYRFEYDLLNAVADEFGLLTCELVRRNLRGRKLGDTTSTVVGLDSYPADTEDTNKTACTLEGTNTPSKCTSMIGYMTAWVSESGNDTLSEGGIYSAIEKFSRAYETNEGVLSVAYDSNHKPLPSDGIIPCGVSSIYFDSLTYVEVGGIVLIAVSTVIILATLALTAKKRKEREREVKRQLSVVRNALVMLDDDEVFEFANSKAIQNQKVVPAKIQVF